MYTGKTAPPPPPYIPSPAGWRPSEPQSPPPPPKEYVDEPWWQRMGLGGWLGIVGGIIGIGERFSLLPPAAACCLLVLVGACSRCCAV